MALQVDFGKIRYNVRGEWDASTEYYVDDLVYRVGSAYRSISISTGDDPITETASWEKTSTMPRDRGQWDSGTTYFKNDIVGVTSVMMYNHMYNWQEEYKYISTYDGAQSGRPPEPVGMGTTSWHLISKGTFNPRYAFLGGHNEGMVPTHRRIWDAYCAGTMSGGIGIVTITSGGSGYTTYHGQYPAGLSTCNVEIIDPAGIGTQASAVAYVSTAGTIFGVQITDPGYGYGSQNGAVTINILDGGGSGATATGFAYTMKIGVADTQSRFKPESASEYTTGGEGFYKYINRQYGVMSHGFQNATYMSNGFASGVTDQNYSSEACFVHLDWYEGVLPTPDGEPPKAIQLENGMWTNYVLFNNGEVHGCGYNANGMLGDSSTANATTYQRVGYAKINKSGNSVMRGKRVVRIASTVSQGTSGANTLYMLVDNQGTREIWVCGYGAYGQRGDSTTTATKSIPEQMDTSMITGKILNIWAGGEYTGFIWILDDHGILYRCGYNATQGALGDGTITNITQLKRLESLTDINNTKVENPTFGESVHGPNTPTGFTTAIRDFTTWGGNTGPSFAIIRGDGRSYNWGYNAYGQLGTNDLNSRRAPQVIYDHGYTGSSGAGVTGTQVGSPMLCNLIRGACSNPVNFAYYSQIDSSNDINVGIATTTYSCGYNGYYNLSVNDATNRTGYTTVTHTTGVDMWGAKDFVMNSSSSYYCHIFLNRQNTGVAASESGWFAGGYNNGVAGVGDAAGYNITQNLDPHQLASNYRMKNNIRFPGIANGPNASANIKIITLTANTSSGFIAWVDLRTGRIFTNGSDNGYGAQGPQATAVYAPRKALGH